MIRPFVAAAVFLSAGAFPAAAQTITGVGKADCQVVGWLDQDADGKPLAKKDQIPAISRCRGLGEWGVYLNDAGDHQGIEFSRVPVKDNDGFLWLTGFGTVVGRIEWKGPKAAAGWPDAAIFRFIWNDPDQPDNKRTTLGVARLGDNRATTCIFAFVEIKKGRDAYAIADKIAADEAIAHKCGPAGTPPEQR